MNAWIESSFSINRSYGSFCKAIWINITAYAPHRSLEHDSPVPRRVESPEGGKVIELPLVGGLHHHYLRQAA